MIHSTFKGQKEGITSFLQKEGIRKYSGSEKLADVLIP